jgi:hypothetical protein
MVFVFIVVAAIGVTKYMTQIGKTEVVNQADCVSRRPPPPGCQIRIATPTTTTTSVGVTTTTAGPASSSTTTTSTTAATSTTAPPPAATTFSNVKRTGPNGPAVTSTFTVKSGTKLVANAEVRVVFEAQTPNGPKPFEGSCITNASGTCALDFDSPFSDTTAITITVIEVTSIPASSTTLPATQTVNFP